MGLFNKLKLQNKFFFVFSIGVLGLLVNILIYGLSLHQIYLFTEQESRIDVIAPDIKDISIQYRLYIEKKDRKYSELVLDKVDALRRNINELTDESKSDPEKTKRFAAINENLTSLESVFLDYTYLEFQKKALGDNLHHAEEKMQSQIRIIRDYIETGAEFDQDNIGVSRLLSDIINVIYIQNLSGNIATLSKDEVEKNLKQITDDGTKIMNILEKKGKGVAGYRLVSIAREYGDVYQQFYNANQTQLLSEMKMEKFTTDITNSSQELVMQINDLIEKSVHSSIWQLVFLFIITFSITGWIVFWGSKGILDRILRLVKVTDKISSGDYYIILKTNKDGDELDKLSESVNEMATNLQSSKIKLMDYNKDLEEQVEKRTTELYNTLEDLKKIQQQIIQSEKLAAVGQLVTGIAHEINTPLGAINSSVGNLKNMLSALMEDIIIDIQSWKADEISILKEIINIIEQAKPILSTREERAMKKQLICEVEKLQLENEDTIVDYLSDIGIYEITNISKYLNHQNILEILNTLRKTVSIKNSINTIDISVTRSARVVQALKSFTHFDNSGNMAEANILDGIETTLTLYHNRIKHGIEVEKDYEEIPLIECNRDDLNQVWTNLIGNALYAMDYKGKLTIKCSCKDEFVTVVIEDSGKGIPDEIKEKIFEPFFTTKDLGEGSGIGLDLTKKIVAKHNGEIWFESVPGCTKFFVQLPIKQKKKGDKNEK